MQDSSNHSWNKRKQEFTVRHGYQQRDGNDACWKRYRFETQKGKEKETKWSGIGWYFFQWCKEHANSREHASKLNLSSLACGCAYWWAKVSRRVERWTTCRFEIDMWVDESP